MSAIQMGLQAVCVVSVLLTLASSQPSSEDNQIHPYKFSFNIESYQHRKEEKDEKGIVRGEYGFITADGYYRITMYTTDENGLFKIIRMKNLFIGFPPPDAITPSNRSEQLLTHKQALPLTLPKSPSISTQGRGQAACSSCFIPPTNKKPQKNLTSYLTSAIPLSYATSKPSLNTTPIGKFILKSNVPFKEKQNKVHQQNKLLSQRASLQPPNKNETLHNKERLTPLLTLPYNFQGTQGILIPSINGSLYPIKVEYNETVFERPDNHLSNRGHIPQDKLKSAFAPQLTSHEKIPSYKSDILYTFNYTTAFYGHHEKGYKNGEKFGDYFVKGRDGISRHINYIANKFGYQPNITLVKLQEQDNDYPKASTEKKYGLKGFEFKWFYSK